MRTSPRAAQDRSQYMQPDYRVPFHVAAVGEEEVAAVSEVIRSGWLTMGPKTFEFERQFGTYVGASHAMAVSTCTAALHLALEAAGIKAGDEVLLPTTTFTATAEAVTYLGAKPVLVDIQPDTMNLDPEDAANRITARTRAIIPVHLGGQPCDMDEIHGLAARHGLRVIEDAAHALPAEYKGKRIGQVSEFTCFSFYATKTLTTGEGGMLTTSNAEAADRIRLMRLHGIERDAWKRYRADGSWFYEVLEAGFKYNLTDMQSAIGLAQLSKCDALRDAREVIAKRYCEAFAEVDELILPEIRPDRRTSWHLFILRLRLDRLESDRNNFITALQRRGVTCSVHFIPLHLQPYYQGAYGYAEGNLPSAEEQYASCLSLPIYPGMQDKDSEHVIAAVFESLRECRLTRVTVDASSAAS